MTMLPSPRPHQMEMKYLLMQMAIQNPDRFFTTFGTTGPSSFLVDIWNKVGQGFPAEERASAEGLAVWHRGAGDGPETVVLTLPPPVGRNEACVVAAIRAGEGCRVFCVELGVWPKTGETMFILSELSAEGRSNWGAVSVTRVGEVVAVLDRLIVDPEARPYTFIPMQLG